MDTDLEKQTAITGVVSTAVLLSGVGLSLGIALTRYSLPIFSGNNYNAKIS